MQKNWRRTSLNKAKPASQTLVLISNFLDENVVKVVLVKPVVVPRPRFYYESTPVVYTRFIGAWLALEYTEVSVGKYTLRNKITENRKLTKTLLYYT